MSLAPREQETLAAIENRLGATDPRFAAVFRLLGDPHSHRCLCVFLSVWVARHGKMAAFAVLTFIVAVCTGSAIAGLLLA